MDLRLLACGSVKCLGMEVFCLRYGDSLGGQVLVHVDRSNRGLPDRTIVDLLLKVVAIFVRHV
jgi:hypothetical protein